MPAASGQSNKAKIARRVIEVLDYFDDNHPEATVLDIVRRYDRPQSSTSELLATLVELGLLEKNNQARTYRLTPRTAMIGAAGQMGIASDGRLVRLVERLAAQTGLSTAVFTLNGINTQIAFWRRGVRAAAAFRPAFQCGVQDPLHCSAAGWLLLSTMSDQRCEGLLRRLNAEAAEDRKFLVSDVMTKVRCARESGEAEGTAGFGTGVRLASVLLPTEFCAAPVVVGIAFGAHQQAHAQDLLQCLRDAVQHDLLGNSSPAVVDFVQTAALRA